MSLQVWLPLNGNLNNQGLSNAEIIVTGATVNTSGKIGSCYSFDGSDNLISVNCSDLYKTFSGGSQQFSVAFWVYHADSTRAIIFGDYGLAGTIGFNIELTTGHQVRFYWNGSPDKSFAAAVAASDWTHIVITYDGSKLNIYKNGILQSDSWSGTLATKNKTSGLFYLGRDSRTGATVLNGRLNDFRIYNHALSVKEVEEISKGLVLHYKFDDTYIENSSFLSSLISTTAYNASLGKYGYNADSNLGKVDGFFQGRQCTKVYTLTANQTAQPYSYFSNLFTSDGTNAPAYKTLSFDYYTTVPTTTWLNIYKLGSGTGTAAWKVFNSVGIKTGTYTNSSNSIAIIPNEWNHIEVTLHGTTNANAEWGYCINGPAHTSSADYYFLYANIQLEEKDHATGYGSNMHSSIIYDSSGYKHNGEIINNISIESNSPRYNSCIHMSATNQKIKISNFPTAGFENSYTFAWWEKISSTAPMHWGFADGIRLNGMYTGRLWNTGDSSDNPLYIPGTTTQVTAPSTGVWHHWVMTGDGTTCKVYQDGVLWGQAKTYKAISGSTIYINGWDSGTSYCSDNASMSDFRIYCTALTAEQIKELYNTFVTIDKNGNVYAREVIE